MRMPSLNTEFLDELRYRLGDEEYLKLVEKYQNVRIRLPSRE